MNKPEQYIKKLSAIIVLLLVFKFACATTKTGTVNGGKVVRLMCPEDYPGVLEHKDWLLRIYKK